MRGGFVRFRNSVRETCVNHHARSIQRDVVLSLRGIAPFAEPALMRPPNGDITRAAGRRRERYDYWNTRAWVNRTQVRGCASSVAYMPCWAAQCTALKELSVKPLRHIHRNL
jgi:hypothetical protein